MKMDSRFFFTAALIVGLASTARAQPLEYEIRFDNADHHEAEVRLRLTSVPSGTLELRMSRSSPGRYALHEFAKNVYDVRVMDGRGRELEPSRPDPHGWNVDGHDGTVEIRYKIFGDRCDGTYLAVDSTHAHMNMPATFMWPRGMGDRRIRLRIVPPKEDWKVATQLASTSEPFTFEAPNLYYFLDSPTEVSAFELHVWEVGGATIQLALHHEGTQAEGAAFAKLAEAVIREQAAMFGELPAFDFGTYTFIADYLPWANSDGMEHRNSTILSANRALDPHAVRNLGTVSHEFFHAWNVERLRPKTLEPFDFERANMSGELWFAEGFTSYYGSLMLKRVGISSLDDYAAALTRFLGTILNAPGRRFFSPVEMSQQAPFVDAAVSVDPTNRGNTFASYYPYGAVVALGLDLTLRSRFSGKTLDDFMRAAWRTYGKTEEPYTVPDLEGLLAEVTGDVGFAQEFFARYIHDSELPDYTALLALGGLELRLLGEGEPSIGASIREDGGKLIVRSTVLDGPAYLAGLDREDVILELGGRPITDVQTLRAAIEVFAPSDSTTIVFEKRGERREAELVFEENPHIEVVAFERASKNVTPEIESFRRGWLGSSLSHAIERHCHECGRSFPFENAFCPYDGKTLKIVPKPD